MRVVLAEWRRVCERQQGRWRATTCVEGSVNGRGGSDELTPRWDMDWSYRPGISGVTPGTVGGWVMAYARTHAATYVKRRGQWAAWRARTAGGSGAEQWERYQLEVRGDGRPVYGKNADRWHARCMEGRHGRVSGRRRRREQDVEDEDETVRRWQRVDEEEEGPSEERAAARVGVQTRQMTRRMMRGRQRQVKDGDEQATELRIRRRDAMRRVAAAAKRGRLRAGTGKEDDERTTGGVTATGKRARRGRKRRADGEEITEAASRRGQRRVKTRVVTARQLERMRGGLGEPFGDG